jgi:hypothetical protein
MVLYTKFCEGANVKSMYVLILLRIPFRSMFTFHSFYYVLPLYNNPQFVKSAN